MAGSLNKVMLIGRLGKDPEMRFTPSGRAVTTFSVATDESWTDQEWRVFQFNHLVATNKRLSKLESQSSWRNVLASIPWAIVGARRTDPDARRRKITMHFTVLEVAGILRISPDDVWGRIKARRLVMEPAGITRKSVIRNIIRGR